jgi:hypothetical protein
MLVLCPAITIDRFIKYLWFQKSHSIICALPPVSAKMRQRGLTLVGTPTDAYKNNKQSHAKFRKSRGNGLPSGVAHVGDPFGRKADPESKPQHDNVETSNIAVL